MKNIHILPTEKPSILYAKDDNYKLANSTIAMDWYISSAGYKPFNIYITNDEQIEKLDWFIYRCYKVCKCTGLSQSKQILTDNKIAKHRDYGMPQGLTNKIILTTDVDLIKDGVQAICDEFLEWFVKNPTCEWVDVDNRPKVSSSFEKGFVIDNPNYNKIIIISKEAQKQHLIDMMRESEKLGLYPVLTAKKKKMLYLVNCKVTRSYYMEDRKETEMNHIVEAGTEQEAMDKVQDFYSKKDIEYAVGHWVDFNYCNEVIS